MVPQVPAPSLEAVAAARTSAVAAQSALVSLPGQFLTVSTRLRSFFSTAPPRRPRQTAVVDQGPRTILDWLNISRSGVAVPCVGAPPSYREPTVASQGSRAVLDRPHSGRSGTQGVSGQLSDHNLQVPSPDLGLASQYPI